MKHQKFEQAKRFNREVVQALRAPEQAYYTVQVYKHTGLGNETTKTNVLATSQEDAMARVAGSCPWLRTNPMYAFKQDGRI